MVAVMTIATSPATRVYVTRSPGVELCVLRSHADRGLTFMIRMAPGARAELHGHPGGEETYVLSGKLHIEQRVSADHQPLPSVALAAGDHLFADPGEVHAGLAEGLTEFLVFAPGGIAPQGGTR